MINGEAFQHASRHENGFLSFLLRQLLVQDGPEFLMKCDFATRTIVSSCAATTGGG